MNPAIELKGLSVRYGNHTVLKDVDLVVPKGEYLGIIGPNGGGKTTLLKAILGLIPISAGQVHLFGREEGNSRNVVGYVPQFASMDKGFPITLYDVVLSGRLSPGLTPFFRYTKEDRALATDLIDKVGLGHLKKRQIAELSGGEFQKMLLARALAVQPEILLLDEPTANVDANARNHIYQLLEELNQTMTIVLVTHDLLALSSQVGKLACLNSTLVYHGEPELTESVMDHLYGCPVDLIAHGVPHRVFSVHQKEAMK